MFERKTPNYGFPQWYGKEHADFINDMNPAYATIDSVLKQASDDAGQSVEEIKALQEKTDKMNENLEKVEQEQASQSVSLANMQHQITDNKNNIAVNAADILVLKEDNHIIHGDIHKLATRYNALLSYDKEFVNKHFPATMTLSDGRTRNLSIYILGNICMMVSYDETSQVIIPPNSSVLTTVSAPGMTAQCHNFEALVSPNFGIGIESAVSNYTTDTFDLRVYNGNAEEVTLNRVIFFSICSYDEITTAGEAIKQMRPVEVMYVD